MSMFASRITISGAELPAATASFLEIVHQFVFRGSACREKRVELCRGCPQCRHMRGILAWAGRDVVSHRFSMASNGDRPGCFQERCQPLPKFPNPDSLCLHVDLAYCVHVITQRSGRKGAPSLTAARTKRGLPSPIPAGLRRPATPRFREPLRGCLA